MLAPGQSKSDLPAAAVVTPSGKCLTGVWGYRVSGANSFYKIGFYYMDPPAGYTITDPNPKPQPTPGGGDNDNDKDDDKKGGNNQFVSTNDLDNVVYGSTAPTGIIIAIVIGIVFVLGAVIGFCYCINRASDTDNVD